MPELECVATAVLKMLQRACESFGVVPKVRRELPEQRPELR
jgi:hypothetical protein